VNRLLKAAPKGSAALAYKRTKDLLEPSYSVRDIAACAYLRGVNDAGKVAKGALKSLPERG
jgi:hypothetical protein